MWVDAQPRLGWAFTLANVGGADRVPNSVDRLDDVDWDAARAHNWSSVKDGKQAEFLMHQRASHGAREVDRSALDAVAAQARQARGAATLIKLPSRPGWYY